LQNFPRNTHPEIATRSSKLTAEMVQLAGARLVLLLCTGIALLTCGVEAKEKKPANVPKLRSDGDMAFAKNDMKKAKKLFKKVIKLDSRRSLNASPRAPWQTLPHISVFASSARARAASAVRYCTNCRIAKQPGQLCAVSCSNMSQSRQNMDRHTGHVRRSSDSSGRAFKQPQHQLLEAASAGVPASCFAIASCFTGAFLIVAVLAGASTKLSMGKRWWYDRARCGEEASGSEHTAQLLGKHGNLLLHRGQLNTTD
jgi:hypothetical protein